MADSIDRVFAHALQTVRKIPRSGSARPPASERLKLYGLYKQSMEGDVEGVMERPSLLPAAEEGDLTREERAEVEKWDAWSACAGLSRSEAKCRYIDALITTMHTYAYGTPEARELVNELEFVWDQVRSNTAYTFDTTTLSSTRRTDMEESTSRTRQAQEARTKEGLRVLRPMSDQDEAEAIEGAEETQAEPNDGTRPAQPRRNGTSWQARVDGALVQLTAEIAALREVVEARGRRVWGSKASRQGWQRWILGRVWALFTRVLVDALVVGVVVVVIKYRSGGPEEVVRLWMEQKAKLARSLQEKGNAAAAVAGAVTGERRGRRGVDG